MTWYTEKPLGVNALKKIVSNLTQKAGLVGHFSNHSLRASAATRMYEQGVDEQTIKHITGHKSDAIQSYKHVNSNLLKQAGMSIVNPSEAHKGKCLLKDKDGKCPPACELLKKIDDKCAQSKVKKVKLSLKYRKK